MGKYGRFEIYAGYGTGRLRAQFSNDFWQDRSNVESKRYFIQPAFGFSSKVFDISFASRLVYLGLYQEGKDDVTTFFMEPAVTMKFGYQYFKFIVQGGFSFRFDNNYMTDFNYRPLLFSVGMQLNFGRLYDKKKDSEE